MFAEQYYVSLEEDLSAMSPFIQPTEFSWNDYQCAMSVLRNTRQALRAGTDYFKEQPSFELQTNLGKRVLKMREAAAPTVERTDRELVCCEEAEWKLAHSLRSEIVSNPKRRSPLLLTIHNQAVAVGKQWGEQTWYGLMDVPSQGIYAGTFSSIKNIPLAQHMPSSEHAYRLELPAAKRARTIRFSLFATPLRYRTHLRTLQHEEAIVTETTHQSIVNRSRELLKDANRLTSLD